MAESTTSVKATFQLIGGDLNPDAVTQALGIEATQVWRRGTPKRLGPGVYEQGRWMRTAPAAVHSDLSTHVAALFDALALRWDVLKHLAAAYEVGLQLVLYAHEANPGPNSLEPDVVQRLAELGAWVDFDSYCWGGSN